MKKKYDLVMTDTINEGGHRLYRVRALRNIQARNPYDHSNVVYEGDLGGYVANYGNLSQFGECWLFPGAIAYDDAQISDNARVFGPATICGRARICDRATVFGKTLVADDTYLYGDASIGQIGDINYPESTIGIFGNARIHGNASIIRGMNPNGDIAIRGDIDLGGNAKLVDVSLSGHLKIRTSFTRNGKIYS